MTKLSLQKVSAQAEDKTLLREISLDIAPGELIALIGPNGAGKSSLLKAAMDQLPLSKGSVQLDGAQLASIPALDRARKVSYLPQLRPLAWPIAVQDVVTLGRFAYGGQLGRLSPVDKQIVEETLVACDLVNLRHQQTDTLSGGELARMHCARAFAARTPLLLADEPVAALDPFHQLRIMQLFRDYVSQGNGALVVLHDLSLAAQFADRLVWMQDSSLVADGPPTTTMTQEQIMSVFGVESRIESTDSGQTVTILRNI